MNKLIILSLLIILANNLVFSQNDSTKITSTEPEFFLPVDKTATFPGGMGKFYSYIMSNINYPEDAKKDKITGKVFVEFVINKDGSIDQNNIRIIDGLSESCNNEAIRLIKESPIWIPASIKGEHVKQRYVVPITFKPSK